MKNLAVNLAKAAKKTVVALKNISRVTARLAKAIVSLVVRVAASIISFLGPVVVVVIVVVFGVIALIAASPLGIFFSGETQPSDAQEMIEAIRDLNQEFADTIESIIAKTPHDEYDGQTGSPPNWKDVLSIYAILTVYDEKEYVATTGTTQKEFLRDVFWRMCSVAGHTSDEYVYDGDGALKEILVHLRIVVTSKTANMFAETNFDEDKKLVLNELLAPGNDEYWLAVLTGARNTEGGKGIHAVAVTETGEIGGTKYITWYDEFGSSWVNWCAIFVSWCAEQAGLIKDNIVPKFAWCDTGIAWFKNRGQWIAQGTGYEPVRGDIIFFDWEHNGISDHVGIVSEYTDGKVHTIEGNKVHSGGKGVVGARWYFLADPDIIGYGLPYYPDA